MSIYACIHVPHKFDRHNIHYLNGGPYKKYVFHIGIIIYLASEMSFINLVVIYYLIYYY